MTPIPQAVPVQRKHARTDFQDLQIPHSPHPPLAWWKQSSAASRQSFKGTKFARVLPTGARETRPAGTAARSGRPAPGSTYGPPRTPRGAPRPPSAPRPPGSGLRDRGAGPARRSSRPPGPSREPQPRPLLPGPGMAASGSPGPTPSPSPGRTPGEPAATGPSRRELRNGSYLRTVPSAKLGAARRAGGPGRPSRSGAAAAAAAATAVPSAPLFPFQEDPGEAEPGNQEVPRRDTSCRRYGNGPRLPGRLARDPASAPPAPPASPAAAKRRRSGRSRRHLGAAPGGPFPAARARRSRAPAVRAPARLGNARPGLQVLRAPRPEAGAGGPGPRAGLRGTQTSGTGVSSRQIRGWQRRGEVSRVRGESMVSGARLAFFFLSDSPAYQVSDLGRFSLYLSFFICKLG
ncbi:uncharacterized protein LOC120367565 [Saimiri boliviensis]|uniref:uncharacterized protein LOC120367565 n=1 Tax=Saimiri boliviensis TaxID=27679 RepID=UPI003D772666